jgi:hypothetical protein
MKIGSLEITPISDGFFKMPPQYFGQDDWGDHVGWDDPERRGVLPQRDGPLR